MEIVARRALTSRSTLQRIESGDPGVGMGIHASVLQALGLLDGVGRLADLTVDVVGQALAESELPQRARLRSSSSLGADE